MKSAYWKNVVDKLTDKDKANWATHTLSSNLEVIEEITAVIDKDLLIKNCLLCYSIDFSAQPYLDDVLAQFPLQDLISIYKKLNKKPIETAGIMMWLIEDSDPDLKCLQGEDKFKK